MNKKHLAVLGVVFIFFLTIFPVLAENSELIVLHTNDLHGHSLARIATLIQEIRAACPHVLLVDGGDLFSGTPISSLFRGQAEQEAVLFLQYDALVVGNHDFDFGQETLMESMQRGLPWLAANIFQSDGAPFAPPSLIKTIGDNRVLLVGLTTPQTPTTTFPPNVQGLVFNNPRIALQDILRKEVGNYDLCLVLSHLGYDEDRLLAKKVPGITAIIGGHSHTVLAKPVYVNETLLAQAGAYGKYLGKITISLEEGFPASSVLLPIGEAIPAHPEILALENNYAQRASGLTEIIGYLKQDLSKREIGFLLATALLEKSGADAALYNGGGIRAGLKAGPITKTDLFTIEPYGNNMVVTRLSGETLARILEIKAARKADYYLGPELVAADQIYTLATSDFLAAGGSNYRVLTNLDFSDSNKKVRQVLENHLRTYILEPCREAASF